MRIVTCASYYGTGSSAITDLIGEFKSVHYMGDYEFRFVQDPEGISDLEYNLVENHHRHNSGHALKRYKKMVEFLSGYGIIKRYEQFFNNEWKDISYRYIDQLAEFTYKGSWHYDIYDRGLAFYILERTLNKTVGAILRKVRKENESGIKLLKNEITYASAPEEEEFLRVTRQYIDELFNIANKKNLPFIMVDQLVSASNLNRYLRYFNDVRVIVVDRDPRDLFLLEKLYWKGGIIPCSDVEVFCKWFEYTRKHRNKECVSNQKVLFVQFEDLVYKYNETYKTIIEFVGLDKKDVEEGKKYFKPDESQKNTNLFRYHKGEANNIEKIQKVLPSYCYNFPE